MVDFESSGARSMAQAKVSVKRLYSVTGASRAEKLFQNVDRF